MIYTKDIKEVERTYTSCASSKDVGGKHIASFSEFKNKDTTALFSFDGNSSVCLILFINTHAQIHLFSVEFAWHDLVNEVGKFVSFVVKNLLVDALGDKWHESISEAKALALHHEYTLIINNALFNYFGNKMLNAND